MVMQKQPNGCYIEMSIVQKLSKIKFGYGM